MNNRFSVAQCVKTYKNADFYQLARDADSVRRKIHGKNSGTVSFVLDRNVTYTNICNCKCKFCAFFKLKNTPGSFVLTNDEVLDKIQGLVDIGGSQIMLQGGLNASLKLDYYIKLLKAIRERFAKITLHSFSPPEIDHIAKTSNKSVDYVLKALQQAGLDSLPGGGGEILIDRIRHRVSPNKIGSRRWLQIMRAAHKIGMKSTATMVFGFGETLQERFTSMKKVRDLQDETGGFRAFIPWPFSPANTRLSNYALTDGLDYLKTVACARLFFDNIKNIHSGWVTEGMRMAQLALSFGANDFGGILMEEKVVRATGLINETNVRELYNIAKNAGYRLMRRNTNYDMLEEIGAGHYLVTGASAVQ
ncbi:MAG TPA: cyclic dehypoxanthinyl futalosine synthase [Candidatus Wallbacteria bacterium]|nr:cyclic dehypoxanthinyl futalosine synthase [Candidatus Wallbacteria bacterium]